MTTALLIVDAIDKVEELPPLLIAVRVLDGVLLDVDETV
jgi:hypothetical protein